MIHNHLRLIFTILFAFPVMASSAAAEQRKPNVILILTDDQGSLDVGCYGATDLERLTSIALPPAEFDSRSSIRPLLCVHRPVPD